MQRGEPEESTPVPVPSLDALADHPELAQQLPREVVFQLYVRAHAAEASCLVALGAAPVSPSSGAHEHDELINARETARVLGRSISWVQQRASETPLKYCLVRSLGRGLLFSRKKIDRLIARETGQNPDDRTQGLRGVNSGRRPRRKGNADLPSTSIPSSESGGG